MTNEQSAELNHFLVNVFNKILVNEKNAILKSGFRNISVSEIHVLEAIEVLSPEGRNTMTGVANQLSISIGALSTSVNTLVRKGYIIRQPSNDDRRIIYITLSELGRRAQKCHAEFHKKMIRDVGEKMSENEISSLVETLTRLNRFFNKAGEAD